MIASLSTYTSSKDNNFNLIRFIASSLVVFSHSFAISKGTGMAEPLITTIGMTFGSIAVDIFFITSGFLIIRSYLSKRSMYSFVLARVLRIFPALIFAMIFCVFVVGTLFTAFSLKEYLLNFQTYKYFVKNIILILGFEAKLPGVFLDVPYKEGVNGSIWTLRYELIMYLVLPIMLTVTTYLNKRVQFLTIRNTVLLAAIFFLVAHIFNHFHSILPAALVRFSALFFIGSAFYLWRERVLLKLTWTLLAVFLLLLSSINRDLFFILYYFLLPYIILYMAYVPSGRIRKFNNCGDYSYGMYIYSFPIQQSAAQLIPNISVLTMIVVSFGVTIIVSMFSWHLIEKKFLMFK